jgi:hypothetical protein
MIQEIGRSTPFLASEIAIELERIVTARLDLVRRLEGAAMTETDRHEACARLELLNEQQRRALAFLETLVKPEGHSFD